MRPLNIILVEDNEGDILLTVGGLEKFEGINNITVIKDGEPAIDFFANFNPENSVPDLVLLDINLPKKSGLEVLVYIKENEKFKHIPVIMLTTSSSEKDILQAYDRYANCYITKSIDVADFLMSAAKIEDFWINTVSVYN